MSPDLEKAMIAPTPEEELLALRKRYVDQLDEGPGGFLRCVEYCRRCDDVFHKFRILLDVVTENIALARRRKDNSYLIGAAPVAAKLIETAASVMKVHDRIFFKDHSFERISEILEEFTEE